MNTLGWAENSGKELFYLGWFDGASATPIVLPSFNLHRCPREPISVIAARGEHLRQTVIVAGTQGFKNNIVFARDNFTNVELRLRSNEELGILDSGYIEDYDGTDGYITLRRVSTGDRVSYPVTPLPADTPSIDNDVFQITVPMASLANEVYELEGRVRDIIGNYTIFGAVASPLGGEDLTFLTLQVIGDYATGYVQVTVPPAETVRDDLGFIDMGRLLNVYTASRSSDEVVAERNQVTLGVGTSGYGSDIVFPRGSFTNMQLVIRSNEELGILDTDYVEDYDGLDGYLTLRRVSTGDRVSYPVTLVPGDTPLIDNDVFQVVIPLSSLENEAYELEGRVRDIIGNHTIFGAVASPIGGESISSLSLEVIEGFSVQYTQYVKFVSVRPALEVVMVERGG